MEDEHHQVGGQRYRIEAWKPALNLFSSLTTKTNCLQENLIIFLSPHCHQMLTHMCPLFLPPFSSYASRFIQAIQVAVSTRKIEYLGGVFFHKDDTGSTKDVLITHSGVRLLSAKLNRGLRTTALKRHQHILASLTLLCSKTYLSSQSLLRFGRQTQNWNFSVIMVVLTTV